MDCFVTTLHTAFPDWPECQVSGRFPGTQKCIALRAIHGFEAMLWLRKGFGFAGVCRAEQNQATANPHDPDTGEILPA